MESLYQTLSRINQIQNTFNPWSPSPEVKSNPEPNSIPDVNTSQLSTTFLDYLNESIQGNGNNDKSEYPFAELVTEASEKYGLPDSLIKSVIQVESNFNEKAVSPKGAIGLMQLMPETAAQYRVQEPYSPQDNIDAGSKHLKNLLDRYDGNLIKALAAYNAGENSFKNDSVPNYKETQNYIKKVVENYMKYNGVKL